MFYFSKTLHLTQSFSRNYWWVCFKGIPLQYCCLENPMDGEAWWATVHGVSKSQTQLSDFTFTFHFHALEKKMETYSSVLAWRIPWTEKPGRLQSMASHRVGHDGVTELDWTEYLLNPRQAYGRRQWHPTPVLLPGKSHGWRSLMGYSPWGL